MIIGKVLKKDFVLVNFLIKTKNINKILVPNVSGIAREMTGNSQMMIIIKKFLSLGIKDMVVFGLNNILFLPQLAKMDYAAGVKVLCELEILKSRQQNENIEEFVLHSQMVDMAIALNNKKVVNNFLYLARKYNFRPGIITYNIESAIRYLSNILNISKNLILYTPLNQIINHSSMKYLKMSDLKIVDLIDKNEKF